MDAPQTRSPYDARGLRMAAHAPTDAPVTAVRDVAIVPTGTDDASVAEYRDHPPAIGFNLGHEVSIQRLSEDDYKLLMAACVPRGHFFFAVPQWGQRYAIVRQVDLATYRAEPYGWDPGGKLAAALALSRLVRDNAHCTEFAGRIVDHADGEQQIIPLTGFESRLAYRYSRTRDWLDATDAGALRAFLDSYWAVEPNWPERVRLGIRYCERASQSPYLSESQPRLVTAFEALFNTDSTYVSRQFRERVRAVARELGIDGISGKFLDRMYDFRSKAYHGDEIPLVSGDPKVHPQLGDAKQRLLADASRLQTVLRAVVRTAIENKDFRASFASRDAVRARWPVRTSRSPRFWPFGQRG